MRFALFALSCLLLAKGGLSWPGGAPTEACEDMTPQHGFDPQPGTHPYTIQFVEEEPGKKFQFWVIGFMGTPTNNLTIEGFMIQARDRTTDIAVGTFDAVPGKVLVIDCFGENTQNCASHAVYEEVDQIYVTWNAPDNVPLENIDFTYTILRELDEYWVKQVTPLEFAKRR